MQFHSVSNEFPYRYLSRRLTENRDIRCTFVCACSLVLYHSSFTDTSPLKGFFSLTVSYITSKPAHANSRFPCKRDDRRCRRVRIRTVNRIRRSMVHSFVNKCAIVIASCSHVTHNNDFNQCNMIAGVGRGMKSYKIIVYKFLNTHNKNKASIKLCETKQMERGSRFEKVDCVKKYSHICAKSFK